MVTGTAVVHMQIIRHKFAVVLAVTLELGVRSSLTQPSDVREFKRAEATNVAISDLHARSDDLGHGPVVELVVLIHSTTVCAGLQSIAL